MNTKQNRPTSLPTHYNNSKIQKKPYRKSIAVKELERLANEAARLKNPNTPVDWLAPRKYRDDNTNGLTKCVIDYLRFNGHFVERTGNAGRIIDNRVTFTDVLDNSRTIGSTKWIPGSGMNGTSDIKAVIKGTYIAIEIKCSVTHDRQSEAQKKYQLSVEQAGGVYLIVNNFQQFYNWYNGMIGGLNNE